MDFTIRLKLALIDQYFNSSHLLICGPNFPLYSEIPLGNSPSWARNLGLYL